MKKLMIAAAIVCAAAFAQAGSINWSALSVTAAPDTTFSPTTSYSAYLFIGTDPTAATKYLSGETYDLEAFATAAAQTKTATYNTTTSKMNLMVGSTYGTYGEGDAPSAYMIIFNASSVDDATYYQVAKVGTGGSGTAGDEVITMTFGKSGNKNYAWGDQSTNTTWNKVGDVPEPTSAMLLLLGMAGLALRRRRA